MLKRLDFVMVMFLDLVVFAHQCETRMKFWRMREGCTCLSIQGLGFLRE